MFKRNLMKFLFIVLSLPYQLIHSFRIFLYNLGFLQKNELDCFVISVGNISFGGTGKTPFTIELAKYLAQNTDLKIAVLTRAYKSSPDLALPLRVDYENLNSLSPLGSKSIGDEAFMMAEEFLKFEKETNKKIELIVDPNRYRSGTYACENLGIDLVILDDGFQHISLVRDMDIILENTQHIGFYRDFPFRKSKANFLFYTKVDEEWVKNNPGKFYISYDLELSRQLDDSKDICVFSALADNESFFKGVEKLLSEHHLKSVGLKTVSFPDHHVFTVNEVNHLLSLGMYLICSKKDFVKIPENLSKDLIVADLKLNIIPNDVLKNIKDGVLYATNSRTVDGHYDAARSFSNGRESS